MARRSTGGRRRRSSAGIPLTESALGPREDQYTVLADWLKEIATPDDDLLDIGAGDGDDEYSSMIRPLVARFVGVDPDDRSEQNPALDEWHPMTIEAFAARLTTGELGNGGPGQPDGFDLAIAVYVAEHIHDPVGFLSAARSCLKPGGSLFLITPNLWHYFGAAAKVSMALGIDDRLLQTLRRRQGGSAGGSVPQNGGEAPQHHHQGHQHHHSGLAAHFPMAYKMNTVRTVRRAAAKAGFGALEVRHLENAAVFETYFPGRFVAIPRAYSRLVHRLGLEQAYGTLIFRLVN